MLLRKFKEMAYARAGRYRTLERGAGQLPVHVASARADNGFWWAFCAYQAARAPQTVSSYKNHGNPLVAIFARRISEAEKMELSLAGEYIVETIESQWEKGGIVNRKDSFFLEGGREVLSIMECRPMEYKGEIVPTDWYDALKEDFDFHNNINKTIDVNE